MHVEDIVNLNLSETTKAHTTRRRTGEGKPVVLPEMEGRSRKGQTVDQRPQSLDRTQRSFLSGFGHDPTLDRVMLLLAPIVNKICTSFHVSGPSVCSLSHLYLHSNKTTRRQQHLLPLRS